jgi:IS5 family transposase
VSEKYEEWLKKDKMKSRTIKRAYRNKALTKLDKQFKRLHSGTHATVARVFGVLKLQYGMAKTRYMVLSRNWTRFDLICVAHNT